ncbi:MAG: 4Fe-4S binding protein [Candidatus Thorarchaeota archaeon]
MKSSKYDDMEFFSKERVQEITEEFKEVIVIPVNRTFEGENRVYSFVEMGEILKSATKIAAGLCGCKREYGNCDAPRIGCISLDAWAEEFLENEPTTEREISVEEALELFQKSHEAGLVHISYTMRDDERPGLICSCCPCCCHTLGSLIRNGTHPLMLTSKYVAKNEDQLCVQCGKCIDRCVFGTREMIDDVLVFNDSICFGCGLCVSTCPEGAISLVSRGG